MHEPFVGRRRSGLRARLLETQNHRCCICGRYLELFSYDDDAHRTCSVKIDKALPRSYENSVVLCGPCTARQGNYPDLMAFHEAFISGKTMKKDEVEQPIFPDTITEITRLLDEAGVTIDVPRGYRHCPPEHVPKIVASILHQNEVRRLTGGRRRKSKDNYSGNRGYKRMLMEAQNHRCCYCGVHFDMSDPFGPFYGTYEHVENIRDQGQDSIHNLVMACSACNSLRDHMNMSAYDFADWLPQNRQVYDRKIKMMFNRGRWASRRKVTTGRLAIKDFRPIYDHL